MDGWLAGWLDGWMDSGACVARGVGRYFAGLYLARRGSGCARVEWRKLQRPDVQVHKLQNIVYELCQPAGCA